MKINQENVRERLKGVPESRRSHIYDATIIIEFLNKVFMPTSYFLPEGFKPEPGYPLDAKSMRSVSEGASMSMGDLYDMYIVWRQALDYTSRIESRYIFSIIVRNLRYYKNGREITAWRVGNAQIWYLGPLLPRHKVPDVEKSYPTEDPSTKNEHTVEADPITPPDEPEEDAGVEVGTATYALKDDQQDTFTESTLDPALEESLEQVPAEETAEGQAPTGEGF